MVRVARPTPLCRIDAVTKDGELFIKPTQVFDGRRLRSDLVIRRAYDGRCILVSDALSNVDSIVHVDGVVSGGFVDLQVNGGGGALFNEAPTIETLQTIIGAHRRFGTSAILPTLITDAPERLVQAAEAVIAAKDLDGILGLHIEGPHIASDRRGAHSAEFIRPFDDQTLAIVERLRLEDILVMITIAPEAATPDEISTLSDMGVIVSLGHSNASFQETVTAISHGACSFTHLFNAMPPLINRDPGIVTAAINSQCYTGIIGDGYHVDDALLKLAIRARPVNNRVFIVSDSMPTIAGPDQFDLYGQKVVLKNGRLINSEGSLAGAHITMAETVERFITQLGIEPSEVFKMAITTPAELIRRDYLSKIDRRSISDLILLSPKFAYKSRLEDVLT